MEEQIELGISIFDKKNPKAWSFIGKIGNKNPKEKATSTDEMNKFEIKHDFIKSSISEVIVEYPGISLKEFD